MTRIATGFDSTTTLVDLRWKIRRYHGCGIGLPPCSNTLIDPSLAWFLLAAYDINDAGQIAAYGINNNLGVTHAVRLRPVTPPPPDCTYASRACLSIAIPTDEVAAEK